MKNVLRQFVLLVIALFTGLVTGLGAAAEPASAALRVITTTTDVAAVARIVGGDRVEVQSIAKGYQDPHYLEAKPSHMVRLRDADLLAYVGLELEVGWLPLLVNGARNERIVSGESGDLVMSEGIPILGIPAGEVTRADGDVHPLGNPHYWLDPRNVAVMARTLEQRLARLDPAHADDFAQRRAAFEAELQTRIARWEARLAPFGDQSVVCYHKQWEYLFGWLGIEIAGYIEPKAGIPPSPQHVKELQEMMRARAVPVVVISNFFEPAPAKRIAERTGAQLVILPASVGGEDGLDDPLAFFDHLVERLAQAFEASRQ